MNYAYLAILALVAAIALGFIAKCNTGLVAIALAYIVGKMAGMSDAAIFKGFPYSLFLLIFGVMFLFSIVQGNDALSLLVQKVLRITGGQAWAMPLLLYIIFLVITSLGTGPYAMCALNILICLPLAKTLKVSPVFLILFGNAGISAGTCSPISIGGLVFAGLLPSIGYDASIVGMAFKNIIFCWTIFIVVYYLVFRGYKLKPMEGLSEEELPRFNKNQMLTLIGVIIFVACVAFFKLNPGSVGLIIGMVLVFLRVANEKETIRAIPWGTILMICGVALVINVMNETGGTDLIAGLLTSVVGPKTAVPFLAFVSGAFSIIAVMSSVVLPTLTPMLPAIIEAIGGNASTMVPIVAAILFSGYATAISPFSSGGGMYMAALSSVDKENQGGLNMKYFLTFLGLGGLFLLLGVAFSFTGLFGIFS